MTITKKCYALITHLNKNLLCHKEIENVHFKLTLRIYLLVKDTDEKVKRWKMTIQEFDCDIEHIPGPRNIVADGSSWIVSMSEEHVHVMYNLNIPT